MTFLDNGKALDISQSKLAPLDKILLVNVLGVFFLFL